jgi:CxxC motif-containing protein (DUF1111 family)
MTPQWFVGLLMLLATGMVPGAVEDTRPGGDTTVDIEGKNAFSMPAANLDDAGRTRFAIGNSFFRRNWIEAPASTAARDGLGPHYIARSCRACHAGDGRGAPPAPGDAPVSLLFRLSVPGSGPHGGPRPEPTYGEQFTTAGSTGVRAEGEVTIRQRPISGRFADGEPYTLKEPIYGFRRLGYGPMANEVQIGPRVAPQLVGVGLLEAVVDEDIESFAQLQALRGDGIQGKVNRVWDAPSGRMRLGRFGWKANVATLTHQTGAAFVSDMGVTSSSFPHEECMPAQIDCRAATRGGAPEIDDATFANVVFYQTVLGPPQRREPDAPEVRAGARLFEQAGCGICHRPRYVTGPSPVLAVAGQVIHPYTDLLLHDMGDALADGRPDYLASGRQWRTPPLWGLGLLRAVSGHQRLLHDGRADGVLEAVLWHEGEAAQARRRVLGMNREERAALVRFVESL